MDEVLCVIMVITSMYTLDWADARKNVDMDMVAKLHQLELDVDGHKVLNMKYFGDTGEGPATMSWKPAGAFEERCQPASTA